MTASTNGSPHFEVKFSGAIADDIRRLQAQASRQGRGPEYLQAIRAIVAALQRSPLEFGEPLYRLKAIQLYVRCAASSPICVEFGVNLVRHVVQLRSIRLLSLPSR